MSDNITVVKEFYAALGRGELPAAIDLVAEDVDWQSPVTRTHPPEIPWSSIWRTKQEVAVFFKQLGQTVKPEGFEILDITAQDERVVVEGKNRGTVHANKRAYEHDWVMLFTIRDGKIVRFRHYYDTGDLIPIFRGD